MESTQTELESEPLKISKPKKSKKMETSPRFEEILEIPIDEIKPSSKNTLFYKKTTFKNTDMLAESIRKRGLLEPIVNTEDKVIISGHRRYKACVSLGLEKVTVRYFPILSTHKDFLEFLREFNNQRDKSVDERLKEEISKISKEMAFLTLYNYQLKNSKTINTPIKVNAKWRNPLTEKKNEIVNAVIDSLNDYSDFLPVTLRKLHYSLAEKYRPLKNTDKEDSVYKNDQTSYKELSKVVTKMRICGLIDFDSIIDEQKTFIDQNSFLSINDFFQDPLYGIQGILTGYSRDLLQSQEKYIEIFCEKEGLKPIINSIIQKYLIPVQFTKGYQSISLCYQTHQRFLRSGKKKGVILFLSDLDPEGENIPESILRNLRQDFGCFDIDVCKIGINQSQISKYKIPENLEAKETSSRYNSFVQKHSTRVYELDALEPSQLQEILEEAITNEIDVDLLEKEIELSKSDYQEIEKKRQYIFELLGAKL